ncbi:MAG: hypothetical protein NTX86_05505 [Candidatus Dependentiae bacterium]|nr:hypothetical protein [Candidatus Dependentiae bacterium]
MKINRLGLTLVVAALVVSGVCQAESKFDAIKKEIKAKITFEEAREKTTKAIEDLNCPDATAFKKAFEEEKEAYKALKKAGKNIKEIELEEQKNLDDARAKYEEMFGKNL